MTKERILDVVKELCKAYEYFRVISDSERNRRIKHKLEDIRCGQPRTIEVAGEERIGYLLSIAIKDGEEEKVEYKGVPCWFEHSHILYLFVNEQTIEYILENADVYVAIGGGGALVENAIYEPIALEDLQGKYIALF